MSDNVRLPSGLELEPNFGIIGIDEEGEIFEGYDGALRREESKMTAEDRKFLGNLMIERWTRWRDRS